MILNNKNIPDNVAKPILEASDLIGVDKGFMFAMAHQESKFDPNIKAKTSSATGLYQFLKGTWKEMVGKYGDKYGIGMEDVKDPRANSIMGALYAKENGEALQHTFGIVPSPADLYAAHFLGIAGAKRFLGGAVKDNSQPGINLVSADVAKANKSIFYNKNGTPKTAKEVYMFFDKTVGQPARQFTLALNNQTSNA